MLESSVERRLVNEFKSVKIELLKFKTPSRNDVPDRICFLNDGITIFIEVKRPGETPRKKQLLYMRGLADQGHYVFVIDNTGKVNDLVSAVLRLSKEGHRLRPPQTIRWFIHRDGVG